MKRIVYGIKQMCLCSLESCNIRYMMSYKQKQNYYFTPETKLNMAFHSCLSTECSYMVFKSFQIEFHAELMNELFVQGHHV